MCNYAPRPCNHGSVLSTRVRVSPGAMGLGPGRTSRPRVPYDEPRPARRSRAQRASVDGRGTARRRFSSRAAKLVAFSPSRKAGEQLPVSCFVYRHGARDPRHLKT